MEDKRPTWLILSSSNKIKGSVGILFGFSIVWTIFWGKFLSPIISVPIIILFVLCAYKAFRIIADIDKKIKKSKSFEKAILEENKVVGRFTSAFFFLLLGHYILLVTLNHSEFDHAFTMRLFSITSVFCTFCFILIYWIYYKYGFLPKVRTSSS